MCWSGVRWCWCWRWRSCRTGRGTKVGAKVGGAGEKGSEEIDGAVGEEKDKDEGKGKGKEEAIEEKGNNEKKKEGAGRPEETGLMPVDRIRT